MNLKPWQAIAFSYGVLLILAETELGPLASLMAWGIAVTYFVGVNVGEGNFISNLFQGGKGTQQTPAQWQQQIRALQGVNVYTAGGTATSPTSLASLPNLGDPNVIQFSPGSPIGFTGDPNIIQIP